MGLVEVTASPSAYNGRGAWVDQRSLPDESNFTEEDPLVEWGWYMPWLAERFDIMLSRGIYSVRSSEVSEENPVARSIVT